MSEEERRRRAKQAADAARELGDAMARFVARGMAEEIAMLAKQYGITQDEVMAAWDRDGAGIVIDLPAARKVN